MEKSIHIVEISNLFGNNYEIKKKNFLFNHILDNILLIEDLVYSIYFIYNKESEMIYIYLINNMFFQNDDNYFLTNHKLKNINNEENIIHYSLLKKDFKTFLFNLDIDCHKNIILEKIYHHFLNYDYNLWNDVNDWLNNNLKYNHFKYHLLFIKINSLIPFSKK
jgi:hypothetical protein